MKLKRLILITVVLFFMLTGFEAFCEKLTIAKCIQLARKNNSDYKILKKSFEINELQEKQAAAKYIPTIKGSVEGRKDYYNDEAPIDSNKYELILEQPLYHFGAIANNLRAARAQKNAGYYDVMEGETQLEKVVYQAYINVLRMKTLQRIKEHSIRTATEQLRAVEEEVKAGKRGAEAPLRWKVLLNDFEDDLLNLSQGVSISCIVLNTLMERDISTPVDLASVGREDFEFDKSNVRKFSQKYKYDEIINLFFKYAKTFSPSLKKQDEEVKVAFYQLKKEVGSNYPQIDLVPKYSADGKEFPKWTYGVRIQFAFLNVSDWKEVEIRQKKLEQVELQRDISYRDRKSNISDRYSKILRSIKQVEVNTKRVEEASDYFMKMEEKYEKGQANDVDMVDAYQQFYDAMNAGVNALFDYYNDSQEIDALIGFSDFRQTPRVIEYVQSPEKYKDHIPFSIDEGGEIFKAVYFADFEKVKHLLAKKPELKHTINPEGWTLLHFCAANDNEQIAEYLIHKGADVNAGSSRGMTPLYLAATQGNSEIIRLLISHGAKVNIFVDRPARTPLMRAAARGFTNVVKVLVEAGADVNAKSELGWTPLLYAAEEGSPEIVEFLLKSGAKVDARNNDGRTAEDLAKMNGHTEVEKILMKAGK